MDTYAYDLRILLGICREMQEEDTQEYVDPQRNRIYRLAGTEERVYRGRLRDASGEAQAERLPTSCNKLELHHMYGSRKQMYKSSRGDTPCNFLGTSYQQSRRLTYHLQGLGELTCLTLFREQLTNSIRY